MTGSGTDTPQAPPPPEVAEWVFGDRLPLAEAYVRHLATSGVTRGLIGPREVPRLWHRHLLNCAAIAELVPADATVIDVGSGAGLPGLPLAIVRTDIRVVLLEPLLRRTTWLEEVVADLRLDVRVVGTRAQDYRQERADVVTARAVAPLERLVTLCMPLVAVGGQLLAVKGAGADVELEAAGPVLRRLGTSGSEVVRCGMAWADVPTTVIRVGRGASA